MQRAKPPTPREKKAWLAGYNVALDDLAQLQAHLRRARQDFDSAIATIDRLRDAARRRLRAELRALK